jgi:hypothetical protein
VRGSDRDVEERPMPRTMSLAHLRALATLAGGALLASASAAAAEPPLLPLPESAPLLQATPKYRSRGMMITGIVLTSNGAASLLVGGVLAAVGAAQSSGYTGEFPPPGFVASIAGVCGLGVGALLTLVGVPLWIVGAQPPKAGVAASIPSWAVPTVAPGPRSAALRWTF